MKIAVLGGGFAGLTASYYAAKKGYDVTLFEKELVLGGLARGFKKEGWDWSLEFAVHHLFTNDYDILSLAKETGYEGIYFSTPTTASLYKDGKNYRIIPVDNPQDFLKFPLLSLPVKIRAAAVLAFLKASPFLKLYEQYSAESFLKKIMGQQAWEVLFAELFRKKFGKYAGNILASFIWARIKKRTRKLGYIKGGFANFILHLENICTKEGVRVEKGSKIDNIVSNGGTFSLHLSGREAPMMFDQVISTLPTPVLSGITHGLFPATYAKKLKKIAYEHAISLVFELKKPYLKQIYWLNDCVKESPIMGVFEHTNFAAKKHYGGSHLVYVGNYVDDQDPRLKMSHEELVSYYSKHLKALNPAFMPKKDIIQAFSFKGGYAQPIFDKEFLTNKPDFRTPVKGFYIANLDMTYPYDRGTNYAVALGKKVVDLL